MQRSLSPNQTLLSKPWTNRTLNPKQTKGCPISRSFFARCGKRKYVREVLIPDKYLGHPTIAIS
jgi:hypothetical protein